MTFKRIIYIFICLCILSFRLGAQNYIVGGLVHEEGTQNPIPLANVTVVGHTRGVVANIDGQFTIELEPGDSLLEVSALGYVEALVPVSPRGSKELIIELGFHSYGLGEVVVLPRENPAHPLLRALIAKKKRNNPDLYETYRYEKYKKWEYQMTNLGEKLRDARIFKNHQEVFKQQEDGRFYLPVFFSEELSLNEYQKTPLKRRTTLLAENSSGLSFLDDLEVSGYTASLDVGYNFYENFIKLYGKNFVSPLADNGLFYYRYYLVDSAMVDGVMNYTIEYKPKRPVEYVFYGEFELESKHFSVLKLTASLSPDANINFIQKLNLAVSYQMVDGDKPFLKRNHVEVLIDYYPGNDTSANRMGLLSSSLSTYSKVDLSSPQELNLSNNSLSYESLKAVKYDEYSLADWERLRHEELNDVDQEVYKNINEINNIPAVKMLDRTAEMILTGYYDMGHIEIGPYLNFINANRLEGLHLGIGGRTSEEISKHWLFSGEVGYGFQDEKWKGAVGVGYKFPGVRRRVAQLFYANSVARIGENERILYLYENKMTPSEDNIVSAMFRRDTIDELTYNKEIKFSLENEWFTGFSSTLKFIAQKQETPPYYPFMRNGQAVDAVYNGEITLSNRITFKDRFIDKGMRRIYLNTEEPVFHLAASIGTYYMDEDVGVYSRLHATMKHNIFFGQTKLIYALESGMVFGKAPYVLLESPRGNSTYGYAKYKFNMMHNLEYVNDKYVHVFADYHLNGFILNRFPFLKRLKFNELFTFRMMLGDLDEKHFEVLNLPQGTSSAHWKPYIELGVGLENVLRFFRFDAIWRLTEPTRDNDARLGIRAGFYIDF